MNRLFFFFLAFSWVFWAHTIHAQEKLPSIQCSKAAQYKNIARVIIYLDFQSNFEDISGLKDKEKLADYFKKMPTDQFKICLGKPDVKTLVVTEFPKKPYNSDDLVMQVGISRSNNLGSKLNVSYQEIYPSLTQLRNESVSFNEFSKKEIPDLNIWMFINSRYHRYLNEEIMGVVPYPINEGHYNVH